MGSEKYKLKWSKYESNILSAFHSLLESETLSDVTLFCEGERQGAPKWQKRVTTLSNQRVGNSKSLSLGTF